MEGAIELPVVLNWRDAMIVKVALEKLLEMGRTSTGRTSEDIQEALEKVNGFFPKFYAVERERSQALQKETK
jgi:hypothetical protein